MENLNEKFNEAQQKIQEFFKKDGDWEKDFLEVYDKYPNIVHIIENSRRNVMGQVAQSLTDLSKSFLEILSKFDDKIESIGQYVHDQTCKNCKYKYNDENKFKAH